MCTPNLYDPKVKILPPTFTKADSGRFCEGKGTVQKSISSCNLVIMSRDLQYYLPLIHSFLQSTPSQMNSAFQELQVYKNTNIPFSAYKHKTLCNNWFAGDKSYTQYCSRSQIIFNLNQQQIKLCNKNQKLIFE